MEIYYCEKCTGRPYTKNLKCGIKCPECGTILKCEDVNEESLTRRPELQIKNKQYSIKKIFSRSEQSDNKNTNSFIISPGEKYYIYLGIKKTGKISFTCRFIIGNTPDRNGIINRTPVVSSEFSFEKQIEMSQLESGRKQIEDYILSDGWEADESLYHVYYKLSETINNKKTLVLNENIISGDNNPSEQYFIDYMQPDYGNISIFGKSEEGFFSSVKKVHEMNNDGYMQCMYFRSRNGDTILELGSFADSSAILFDDPYTSIIRYDRIMKEIKMPRI